MKKEADAKFDTQAFLSNCRTRLLALVIPDDEWAWWKYATDKSWIMPNESLAAATSDKMFEGYDAKDIRSSVAGLFDAHCTAVNAMSANCPPEFREEILRGLSRCHAHRHCTTCATCTQIRHLLTATPLPSRSTKTWLGCCGARSAGRNADMTQRGALRGLEWMFLRSCRSHRRTRPSPYKGLPLGQDRRLDSKCWFGIVMNFKAEPFKGKIIGRIRGVRGSVRGRQEALGGR